MPHPDLCPSQGTHWDVAHIIGNLCPPIGCTCLGWEGAEGFVRGWGWEAMPEPSQCKVWGVHPDCGRAWRCPVAIQLLATQGALEHRVASFFSKVCLTVPKLNHMIGDPNPGAHTSANLELFRRYASAEWGCSWFYTYPCPPSAQQYPPPSPPAECGGRVHPDAGVCCSTRKHHQGREAHVVPHVCKLQASG